MSKPSHRAQEQVSYTLSSWADRWVGPGREDQWVCDVQLEMSQLANYWVEVQANVGYLEMKVGLKYVDRDSKV